MLGCSLTAWSAHIITVYWYPAYHCTLPPLDASVLFRMVLWFLWNHCTLVGYIPYFPLVLLFNSPNVMLSSQWNIGWTMNCMEVLLGALLFCHIIRGWIESDKKWSAVENRWRSQCEMLPCLSTSQRTTLMKCHRVLLSHYELLESFSLCSFLCLQPKVLSQSEMNCVVFILLIECTASKWRWPQRFLCRQLFMAAGCTVEKNAKECIGLRAQASRTVT